MSYEEQGNQPTTHRLEGQIRRFVQASGALVGVVKILDEEGDEHRGRELLLQCMQKLLNGRSTTWMNVGHRGRGRS